MPKSKSAPKPDLETPELWLIRACFIVALAISLFLAWNSLKGGAVPGCGAESGCDRVLNSRWGYVYTLPVSIFAAPVYLALLVLVRPRSLKWSAAVTLAFLVIASALWFVSLQTFVLRAFCKFCMTAHAAGVFGALMVLRKAPLASRTFAGALAAAGLGVAALATAQVIAPERGPKQILNTVAVAPAPQPAAPPSATPPIAAPNPTFAIVDGEFTLDLMKVPVAGPVNAPKKVAKLFDYTCHHCRNLHHLLEEFRAKHSNELAVISLPLPLDGNCNPMIKKTVASHVNACEYARLGLAVFQANPEKFDAYTDWIYTPARPPELAKAREYAANLVGPANLENALQKPAVAEQIKTDVDIYMAAYRHSHSSQLPQMYFPQGASIGAVEGRADLEKIMADNLGFPPPK